MFWFNRPLRLLGVIVLSVIVLTGCDQTSPLNVGDRDENGALRATSGGEPAWSQPTGDRTPYGCTFTELDGDLQPIGEEMYLALPPSLLAARVPAFEQHVKKGLDTKGKEIHLMFKWPSWYARPGETGDFQNAKDRTGPRFVARCLVPRLPVASSVSKAPAVPTPSVFSDVIRERIRPMMEERLQEIRAFRQDRPLGIRDVRPRDANGRVGPTKTAARQVGKSGTEVFGSLHELFDAATEEVISTYPNCSRVGIWYWMNADGTYEIESATCQAFAPPLGGGGSGVGGGDTCYDGPGSDPSLPLCELHPDDAVEIEADEVPCGVTPWDVVDWISLGISLNDFIQDPSLENLGWLILDALGAALPVLPALGTVQNAGELIDSANDVLKTKSIFAKTPDGSIIPIPKGMEARVADNGQGIVFNVRAPRQVGS